MTAAGSPTETERQIQECCNLKRTRRDAKGCLRNYRFNFAIFLPVYVPPW
jgi:hypothetical protein